MAIDKCQHPGLGRKLISRFSFLGPTFADKLNNIGVFIQKTANALRFEHFWTNHVMDDLRVILTPSFMRNKSKHAIWDIAIKNILSLGDRGTVLEFGTNNGGSLRYFWHHLPDTMTLHGFDCFEGIPEPWDSLPKGSIKGHGFLSELWADNPTMKEAVRREVAATGRIPQPPQKNIIIHKGLFAHTLPYIMADGIPLDIRLIHFDADIYMGTRPVLDAICGQINYRYYILFDELYSVNHEFKAWLEFIDIFSIQKWRVAAISEDGVQALIEVN